MSSLLARLVLLCILAASSTGGTPNRRARTPSEQVLLIRRENERDASQGSSNRSETMLIEIPSHRLTASTDCLTLNKGGFPLPVDELMKQYPTKQLYFDHIQEIGYKGLEVAARGRATVSPNTCSTLDRDVWVTTLTSKSHFIFVGDCHARMSFEASIRNRVTNTMLETGARPRHMIEKMNKAEESTRMQAIKREEGFRLESNSPPLPPITHDDDALVTWLCGTVEEAIAGVRDVIQANTWDPGSVTVWANCAVFPFFGGKHEWISDREAQLRKVVRSFRQEFPGIRLAWMTAPYIDMNIMGAHPRKADFDHFVKANVQKHTREQIAVDEKVMESEGVAVVPRADVSAAYRGLQCDGIHNDPHTATHAESWDCPGYPEVEDLILQAGIASLCWGGGLKSICKPTSPTEAA